jgi:hypothetical protein
MTGHGRNACFQRRKRRRPWLPVGRVLAQHRTQQPVHPFKQRSVCAVRRIQIDQAAVLPLDCCLLPGKDGHIRAAKAVDRLFGIADNKELACVGAKQADERALAFVCILEFVDQQRLHLALPVMARIIVLFQQFDGQRFQIVKIDTFTFAF